MTDRSQPLERALGVRKDLAGVLGRLESAIAAPAARPRWREDIESVLDDLRAAFREHVDVTEEEMFAEVIEIAPRLVHAVDVLRREHDEIEAAIERSRTVGDATRLRDEATALIGRLVRHRQKGADLLYEAYEVDVSVGD